MPLSRYQKGALLTLLAAFFFAGKTILVKLAYLEGADPVSLIALRMCIAGACFIFILAFNLARGRWKLDLGRKQWLMVAILGIMGYYLSAYLDLLGLFYIDATLGRMILFLYPTMVVIIHAVIVREMLPGRVVLALALSYLGLVLMMAPNLGPGPQEGFWKGCGLVFLSALVYSFYLTGVDRYFGTVNMGLFISLAMCCSCLVVFAQYIIASPVTGLLDFNAKVYIYVLILGTLSTVLPIYAMSMGIALMGASKAAIYNMTGPIMTMLMGVALLGERPGLLGFLGALMIIVGVAKARPAGSKGPKAAGNDALELGKEAGEEVSGEAREEVSGKVRE
ncbi:MAG: DMT family transporter [Deltaproteobacteria bacterium]|jgi:drug/metabolite transporter (DMT)-like permease|nr:DMT family transporter [Deltaproteobacteria bacterium]